MSSIYFPVIFIRLFKHSLFFQVGFMLASSFILFIIYCILLVALPLFSHKFQLYKQSPLCVSPLRLNRTSFSFINKARYVFHHCV